MHTNRITKFWLKPPEEMTLGEAFEAADGELIHECTDERITALASSEGTTFLLRREEVPSCPPGADVKKHLSRELRRLAFRYQQAARALERGQS